MSRVKSDPLAIAAARRVVVLYVLQTVKRKEVSRRRAMENLIANLDDGTAPMKIQRAAKSSCARSRGSRVWPSRQTLAVWVKVYETSGGNVIYLRPKTTRLKPE